MGKKLSGVEGPSPGAGVWPRLEPLSMKSPSSERGVRAGDGCCDVGVPGVSGGIAFCPCGGGGGGMLSRSCEFPPIMWGGGGAILGVAPGTTAIAPAGGAPW